MNRTQKENIFFLFAVETKRKKSLRTKDDSVLGVTYEYGTLNFFNLLTAGETNFIELQKFDEYMKVS